MSLDRYRALAVCGAMISALTGCVSASAVKSVPSGFAERAQLDGYSDVRAWSGSGAAALVGAEPRREAILAPGSQKQAQRDFLVLSGGGDDGAFGAGILVGWSVAGTRPVFSVVTGVSTGALIAPFAFLGSEYDDRLARIYTAYGTSDIVTPSLISALSGGPSLAASGRLEGLIARYMDQRVVTEIAREHKLGRRLLISTTDLATQKQVIWSLGAIAASDRPDALALIRTIIRASVTVPGLLPPVAVDVTVGDSKFQELHADGGTTEQLFFVSSSEGKLGRKPPATGSLYVIRHGKLEPKWSNARPTVYTMARRSIDTLIKSQIRGDLDRLRAKAKTENLKIKLAAVPATFTLEPSEPFDVTYMRALFAVGFEQAKSGFQWSATDP